METTNQLNELIDEVRELCRKNKNAKVFLIATTDESPILRVVKYGDVKEIANMLSTLCNSNKEYEQLIHAVSDKLKLKK